MRGLLILADRYYVTSEPVAYNDELGCFEASLAGGGMVQVPRDRLLAAEWFTEERELSPFRGRLDQLRRQFPDA